MQNHSSVYRLGEYRPGLYRYTPYIAHSRCGKNRVRRENWENIGRAWRISRMKSPSRANWGVPLYARAPACFKRLENSSETKKKGRGERKKELRGAHGLHPRFSRNSQGKEGERERESRGPYAAAVHVINRRSGVIRKKKKKRERASEREAAPTLKRIHRCYVREV